MMKILLGLMVVLLILSSCSKRKIDKIENYLLDGTWKVQAYTDDGEDKTSDFNNLVFTFKSDGVLALEGIVSVNGTWDVSKETDGDDDDLFDKKHFELIINVPYPYDQVSEDWEIENYSDTKFELKDVSGDGSEEILIFTKN
jgi:hypothetical protein